MSWVDDDHNHYNRCYLDAIGDYNNH